MHRSICARSETTMSQGALQRPYVTQSNLLLFCSHSERSALWVVATALNMMVMPECMRVRKHVLVVPNCVHHPLYSNQTNPKARFHSQRPLCSFYLHNHACGRTEMLEILTGGTGRRLVAASMLLSALRAATTTTWSALDSAVAASLLPASAEQYIKHLQLQITP